MKRWFASTLAALMVLSLAGCGGSQESPPPASGSEASQVSEAAQEEPAGKQTATEYQFDLAEGEARDVQDLIFEEDVTANGENARITFVNCEFKGDIINTANEGTQVILAGSTLDGRCVFRNQTKEATFAWSFPKFLVDAPVEAVCEECVGALIPMGSIESTFNGESYTMESSTHFSDVADQEAGLVPYEGQEASYYCIAQWWENGEKQLMIVAEHDPNM